MSLVAARRSMVIVSTVLAFAGMAVAEASALTFSTPAGSPFPAGTRPLAVAIGDLNADGKLDLATANARTDSVMVLLGDGVGGFAPAAGSPIAAGGGPFAVAIGDLNADGKPDLATANANAHTASVLLGDGVGGFAPAAGSPITVGTTPNSVAIGDLNADGKPDLATANTSSGDVTVLMGDGVGGFTPAAGSPIVAGNGARSVAIGDFNADGKPDLATANSSSNSVMVLLGDGVGGFTPAAGSPIAAGTGPSSVAIGDFNADGKRDLTTANTSGNVTVLLGDGGGGFAPAAGSPFAVGANAWSVAIGDLNVDGKPDLATTSYSPGTVTVLMGDGVGGFTPATGSPFAAGGGALWVAIGDLNGDAKPDLTTANRETDNVTVLVNASVAGRIVSSSSLAFGLQAQSTLSAAQTLTVTGDDMGVEIARISRTGADKGEFLLSDDTCSGQTLARGESCTVDVRFVPTSSGAKSATLSINDNTGSPVAATLSGTGGDLPTGPTGPTGPTAPRVPQGPPALLERPERLELRV